MEDKSKWLRSDFSDEAVRSRVLGNTTGQPIYPPRIEAATVAIEKAVLSGNFAPDSEASQQPAEVPTEVLGETIPIINGLLPESHHGTEKVVGTDHPLCKKP